MRKDKPLILHKFPGRSVKAVAVFILSGVLGTYLLTSSHAATPTAAVEAESSAVSSMALIVSDSAASNNQAVKFGAGTPGGNCSATSETPGGDDPWGGCWPGASNTGVPAGTTLTTVNGDLTVSTDNQVVSGQNVKGCIDIQAVGVTVKNSKAKCISTSNSSRARDTSNARLTIQDSEIDCGGGGGTTAIGDRNINVYRTNIHGCENGFDADSDITITDSYIHDLYNSASGDPHTDGLQSAVGSNLVITHNVFYGFTTGCVYPNANGSCNGTSAINVNNASGGPHSSNTTISRNLLAGGAYTLYCPLPSTVNFQITENHFSTIYSPHVGEYGASTDCSGETGSGNVMHETGQAYTLQ